MAHFAHAERCGESLPPKSHRSTLDESLDDMPDACPSIYAARRSIRIRCLEKIRFRCKRFLTGESFAAAPEEAGAHTCSFQDVKDHLSETAILGGLGGGELWPLKQTNLYFNEEQSFFCIVAAPLIVLFRLDSQEI